MLAAFFLVISLSKDFDIEKILFDTLEQRTEFVRDKSNFEDSYETRNLGMKTELNLWLNSPIVIGVGAAYPPQLTEPHRGDETYVFITGALDHVAFSSYLAHFGLFGFIVYLIMLPVWTIKIGLYMLSNIKSESYSQLIIIMGIMASLFTILNPFGSMLLTTVSSHIDAVCYGAIWGLYTSMKKGRLNFNELSKD